MPDYLRAFIPDAERAAIATAEPGSPITFTASSEGTKRDGLDIAADAWDTKAFAANPAVLWSHDYIGNRPPIGRAEKVWSEDGSLKARILFDPSDEFSQVIERKYRTGFLNAVSVGFDVKELDDDKKRVTKAELLDISAVNIPGDPSALMERQKRGLASMAHDLLTLVEPDNDPDPDPEPPEGLSAELTAAWNRGYQVGKRQKVDRQPAPQHRGAIPPHSTAKAPEDTAWDGPREVAAADGRAALRRMHTWVDAEGDPDLKQSYKLPHHLAENGEVVWRGVAAAMARLLQAGTQIPDADRRGAFNHLSRHYQQFDKTPPEFRTNDELAAYSGAELRGLFLEGEPELFPDFFSYAEQRAGAVLSARNRDDLEQAITLVQGVIKRAAKEAPPDEPTDDERAADEAAKLLAILNGVAA